MKEELLNSKLIRKIVKKRTLKHDNINCVFCGKCANICNVQSITINRKRIIY